jgi:hypothetical protein
MVRVPYLLWFVTFTGMTGLVMSYVFLFRTAMERTVPGTSSVTKSKAKLKSTKSIMQIEEEGF